MAQVIVQAINNLGNNGLNTGNRASIEGSNNHHPSFSNDVPQTSHNITSRRSQQTFAFSIFEPLADNNSRNK